VGCIGTAGIVLASCEIDFLLAFLTDMFAIELVRKYLDFRSTILTFTEKRFQVPEVFKTGAVAAWCIHSVHLIAIESRLVTLVKYGRCESLSKRYSFLFYRG